jgi:hypothetical protein
MVIELGKFGFDISGGHNGKIFVFGYGVLLAASLASCKSAPAPDEDPNGAWHS